MNSELTKYYLSLAKHKDMVKMPETSYFDIIKALEEYTNGSWAWEITDERFILDGTRVSTTVALYIPGRVCTGRSLCKASDYHNNHLFALLDACQVFMEKKKGTLPVKGQPPLNEPNENNGYTDNNNNSTNNNIVNHNMTPDEIMQAINNPNGQQPPKEPVETAAQFNNYKDENGMPADAVPMNQMTDNCMKEVAQEFNGMNPPEEVPSHEQESSPQKVSDYDTPNPKLRGFSQRQVDDMRKFKKDYDIVNDDMFASWVNAWNPSLTSKNDIVPDNVDEFIAWIRKLEKEGC